MKVYDYYCWACDNTVEEYVQDTQELVKCKTCGEARARQVSAPKGYVSGSDTPVKQ